MGLTSEVARRVAAFPLAGTDGEAAAIVSRGFADCVGVMLAGWREPAVETCRRYVGSGSKLTDAPVDPLKAALLFGTAAHVLDYDDTGLTAHPSAVLVPAILAESLVTPFDGRSALTAYLAGYELWAELWTREPGQHHSVGWHPTAMLGTIAAAATSARLRGADEHVTRTAIAIAASMAGGVVSNFGSMTKPLQVGRAVANGLEAVRLAEAGFTAAPDALEHRLGFLNAISPARSVRVEPEMPEFGSHILRHGINIKLYPVCYAAHRAIDGMMAIRSMPGFDLAKVDAIDVEIGATQAAMLRHAKPESPLDAKFSIQFALAAAALFGAVGLRELSPETIALGDLRAIYPKVRVHPLTETSPDEPAHSPYDRVVATMADGRRLDSGEVRFPEGHFRKPVGVERLKRKFVDCAAAELEPHVAAEAFERTLNVGRLKRIEGFAGFVGSARPSEKAA